MTSLNAESGKDDKPTAKEQLIRESLIAECRDLGERIVILLTSLERILATGAAVLAITASVVVATNKSYFLMLLPAALSVVLLYSEFVNNDIKSMGAYKAALEEEIERRLGFPVILWESKVVRLGEFNHIYQTALSAMFLLAMIGSIWVAGVQAWAITKPGHWGHQHWIFYVVGTALSIVVGLVALVKGFRAHEENMATTYKIVSGVFSDANQKPNLPGAKPDLGATT
jgi:hypothetical protein